MERIKQALELARQERIKNGGRITGSIAKPVTNQQSIEGQDIKYTNTRTVPMPVNEFREKRIITEQQNNISDAYRILRTQVLQRLNEKNWNTLAITSPGNGEGKSLTAINLAMSLAREIDNTVLLVDANLRSPKLDKYFDFHTDYGLSDYLLNDKPLDEMLVNPEGVSRFVVLPAGRAIANSSEMLSSPKMQRLVEEVKHRYPSRIVIFDLPPLLESSDTLAFIPNADTTLVVIEEGKTQETELKQAFEILQGNEVIGTVLNKAYTTDKDYAGLDLKPGLFAQILSKLGKKSA
ncbi:MAG: exopolysaccharide biosynthesis protein [endosymbiont of Galathealinum brachiosum]|uniref:Exopolysaccharide biosynthesis protein n=1 Tax=endosymbiont of Galathealinum brachiosum TaxID=2200906 RepID=A0A370D7Z1_9GAMM|nr:MAG: exopolysaccharide biosynthesis protein [endosymbiont of Galathealinum brachiosum]